MKSRIKYFAIVLSLVLLGSCQNYNELVKNPNLPTAVPPSLILTGLLEHFNAANAWNGKQGSQSAAQFWLSTYDYYGTNNYDQSPFIKSTTFSNSPTNTNFEYTVLQNVVQMELEAAKGASTQINPYGAIAKFLKAYYYN